MEDEARSRAIQVVLAEMARRTWTTRDLARAASIDAGTAGDFLNGSRWPKIGTLGKLDRALGWEFGSLARVAREGGTPVQDATVGASLHDDDVLFHLPASALEGLSEVERTEVIAKATAAALQAAREIRGR